MDVTSAVYVGVFYSISAYLLEALQFIFWLVIPRVYKHKVSHRSPVYAALQRKLTGWHISKLADGTPYGVIIGRWYIAYAEDPNMYGDCNIIIVCTRGFISGCAAKKEDTVDIKYHTGRDSWTIKKVALAPTRDQRVVLSRMNAALTQFKNGVYLFWGPPGTGKSCVVDMLATKLKLGVVPTVNFFDFELFKLCGKITVINEVDDFLDVLIGEKENKKMVQYYTKQNWNNMLDFVNSAANTIMILTTNVDPAKYDRADPSLLRAARVRLRAKMARIIE